MSSEQETQDKATYWIIIDNVGRPKYKMSISGVFSISADCRERERNRFIQHLLKLYPDAVSQGPWAEFECRRRLHRACDDLFNNPTSVQELALWSNDTKAFEEKQLQISLKPDKDFQGKVTDELDEVLLNQAKQPPEDFKREPAKLSLYTVTVNRIPEHILEQHYPTHKGLPAVVARELRMERYRSLQFTGMEVESMEVFLNREDAIQYAEQLECKHEVEEFDIDPEQVDHPGLPTAGQPEHRAICEALPKEKDESYRVIMLNHTLVYAVP
ncbi:hypothetical protein J4E90_008573 [Alternaria incomplexa]|uniref:uncharacterized protein n=1 Tax=Alternaria incomplexa TaxID=1187928 RepID=UPI00221F4A35|nr:uncharacterized protein J4E90_008573 [Alternaria incomplexa]KAI4908836.1 hypothetical protein J4E90_008573 [Alternaria incomplexa]